MNIPRFDSKDTHGNRIENSFSEKRKIYIIIQKILTVAVILCLFLALETTYLSSLPIPYLGNGAPAMGLLLTLAVAFLGTPNEGCVTGCMAGFMTECLVGTGYMICPIFYAVIGYVVGIWSKKMLGHNLPSFVIYVFMGSILETARLYVTNCFEIQHMVSYHYLLYGMLPRFLWTIVFAPVIYVPVLCIKKLFDKKI